ncbi:LysM peptidoglycan-binding domain-containing protein [Subtercola endophyticus]|uniref:LysM peptidoglycan-binding domain-containing protein n=1 Tax=Subtercola endophyticus TaxID=2895559 RepID=UPI001E33722A|nr:LysM peptidoglycan-binding domain-containing protein [Subtercola endophyticus]UFS60816.1 LysM peptidoglycan-binding domain-containing protein [Subtercola endophyticus]
MLSSHPLTVVAAVFVASALTAGLVGCTGTNAGPSPSATVRATESAAAAAAAPSTSAPAPSPAPVPAPVESTDSTFRPVDSGSRTGASGSTSSDSTGTTGRYVVADGDTLIDISFRFGVDVTELVGASDTRYDYGSSSIQPGDVITFKSAPFGHQ